MIGNGYVANSISSMLWAYDETKLVAATYSAISTIGWDKHQLSITMRKDGLCDDLKKPTIDGVVHKRDEWFDELIPEFRGTYFEYIWNDMNNNRLPVCRMRLLKMSSMNCLTFHKDDNERFHIPDVTNPHVFFVMRERDPFKKDDLKLHSLGTYHLPTGGVYWVDTTTEHSVMNSGKEDRIHLVLSRK